VDAKTSSNAAMQVVELMAAVCRSGGPNRLCPTRPDRPGTKRPPPQTGVQAASLRAPHRRRPDGSRSSGMNRADQEPPADPRGLGLGPAGHCLGPAPQPPVRSSLIF